MAVQDFVTREHALELMAKGIWPTTNAPGMIQRCARRFPNKTALVDPRRRVTFAEFDALIDQFALALLDLGIGKGDVIVNQLPNNVEHLVVQYGAQKIGAINVVVMMTLRAAEMKYVMDYTEAKAVAVPDRYRTFNHAAMIAQIKPELPHLEHSIVIGDTVPEGMLSFNQLIERGSRKDPSGEQRSQLNSEPWLISNIQVTTGTTGPSKFALYRDIMPYGRVLAERSALRADDVFLAMSPINGGGSIPCKFESPYAACTVVCQETFDPEESLELIQREKVTFVCGVPAQLAKLLDVPNGDRYDLSSVRLVMYSGSVLAPEIGRAFAERTGGCRIMTQYGGLDCGILCATSIFDDPEGDMTRVGRPMPGVDVRLLDDDGREVPAGEAGELTAFGPNCRAGGGYYKDPEANVRATTPDGWYKTGDMAVQHPDGTIGVVGRKKDLIIRGGQNISPKEVEDLLIGHPRIADVSIVAMPDRVMGEKACAYVVPRGNQPFTFEEMVSFLKTKNIAPYKLPERLELIDRLPMAGDGQKVSKVTLREDVERKLREEGKL